MAAAPNNWDRLKEVVADAIDAPAHERDAVLAAACADDAVLAGEARKLIGAHDGSSGVVLNRETDAWLGLGGPDVLSMGGQRIGRYRLDRVLGEGAMSAVYLARQANPDRAVAVKLLRTALPLVDARQRFRREAQALARLRHPNIAVIYEAGLHDTGDARAIPFIAMEYVEGLPLTDHAAARGLGRRARIELLIRVASVVQHAHGQAIIHRDLKPANVLVDAAGEPKVLDFGIARIAAADSDRGTWQTTAGLLLGTPGYMSPEQCGPDADGVDVRTDVWSLGVMLYELLLGRLPIEARGGALHDVIRRLESSEPAAPESVDPTVRGDLATVLMTAVCRDKSRRYATAQAFVDDLNRYLRQLPIEARPPTTLYLASKFVRRHHGAIVAAAIAAVALVGSTLASSAGFYSASRERDLARASERRANDAKAEAVAAGRRSAAVRDFLVEMIGSPDPMTGHRDVTVLDMLRQNEANLDARFASDPATAAELYSTIGWTYFNLSEYDAAVRNLRRAIELRTTTAGRDALVTIDDRCRLVTALRWNREYAAARVECDAALADALRTLGPDHASTFPLLDNDAGIAEELGDINGSIEKYRRVYDAGIRTYGANDDQVLTSGNNLGLALQNVGRYAEAERVLRDVVARADQLRGADSFRAIIPRQNLAVALTHLERPTDAEEILLAAVATAERELPEGHSVLRSVWLSLADTRRQLGRFDEAIALMRRVEHASVAAEGRSGASTVYARIGMMATLAEAGQTAAAAAIGRAALADCEADGVTNERHVWALKQNFAGVLDEPGTAEEAERLAAACVAHLREIEGGGAAATLIASCNHGGTLVTLGRLDDAERVTVTALANVGPDHGLIEASLRRLLARINLARGKHVDARAELDRAWSFMSTTPNPYYRRRAIDLYVQLAEATHDAEALAHWRSQRDELIARQAATTRPTTPSPP